MHKPLVSVIMSVFNEEQYVKDAIECILNQTYDNFEFIIIDDYSTDSSLDICRSFKDPRIRIYSKTNDARYLAASRNIAIEMAKGQYIIGQDADDLCVQTRIEKQLSKALENPGRRIVGCSIKRIENGTEHIIVMPETNEQIVKGFNRIYNRTTIVAGTILAPAKIIRQIRYRVRFKYMQDWDHCLRLFETGKVEFCNCAEPLYTYYIRSKSVLFKPEWLDYNIFIRHCQRQRRKGMDECQNLEQFLCYLDCHPLEKMKWHGLKKLIGLQLRMRTGK